MEEPGSRTSNPSAKSTCVVSLITQESDDQREQVYSADQAARRLNVDMEICYADDGIIKQSEQLPDVVQNDSSLPEAKR